MNTRMGINLIVRTLTNIAALAVLITRQASVGRVVASYHSSIVVDDCIQVIDGGLLHLVLLADTEITQIQIPTRQHYVRELGMKTGERRNQSFAFTIRWVFT